tara:strand:- start:412 stop:576 length:165 start_codon:yes stop_codon:yes gene_type:complete
MYSLDKISKLKDGRFFFSLHVPKDAKNQNNSEQANGRLYPTPERNSKTTGSFSV